MKHRKLAIGLAMLTACYLAQFTVAVATRKDRTGVQVWKSHRTTGGLVTVDTIFEW